MATTEERIAELEKQSKIASRASIGTGFLEGVAQQYQIGIQKDAIDRNVQNLGRTLADVKRLADREVERTSRLSDIQYGAATASQASMVGLGSSSFSTLKDVKDLSLVNAVEQIREKQAMQEEAIRERKKQLEEQQSQLKLKGILGAVGTAAKIGLAAYTGGVGTIGVSAAIGAGAGGLSLLGGEL